MFGISMTEAMVLVTLALCVLGPQRTIAMACYLGGLVSKLKRAFISCRSELGLDELKSMGDLSSMRELVSSREAISNCQSGLSQVKNTLNTELQQTTAELKEAFSTAKPLSGYTSSSRTATTQKVFDIQKNDVSPIEVNDRSASSVLHTALVARETYLGESHDSLDTSTVNCRDDVVDPKVLVERLEQLENEVQNLKKILSSRREIYAKQDR